LSIFAFSVNVRAANQFNDITTRTPPGKRLVLAGAIQSGALTLRIFVIRLVGSDLRARRFCRTWPNRPPNRRFYG